MGEITGSELHKQTYDILSRVRAGEEFTILQGQPGQKKPVATLGAIEKPEPPPPPPPEDPQPVGWTGNPLTLKFRDEFAGTSLDQSKWFNNDSGGQSHYGAQGGSAFKPSQTKVANGQADLYVSPTPYAGQPSAGVRIDTMGRFEFKYGFSEARMKLCKQQRNWSAFWTNGHSWPADGEVDVFETLGDNHHPVAHIHTPAGGPGVGGAVFPDSDTAWHTYAAHWLADRIVFLYDGKVVGTWWGSISSPHHLILSQQGPYSGSITAEDFCSVDYVRVWQ